MSFLNHVLKPVILTLSNVSSMYISVCVVFLECHYFNFLRICDFYLFILLLLAPVRVSL